MDLTPSHDNMWIFLNLLRPLSNEQPTIRKEQLSPEMSGAKGAYKDNMLPYGGASADIRGRSPKSLWQSATRLMTGSFPADDKSLVAG